MYFFLGAFIFLAIVCAILGFWRVRTCRKKVCALSCFEKNQLLNELIEPFGFSYDPCKDLFFSRIDAWQREFGYSQLYDQAAPHVQLVFDCEPIYFNAHGRTWLLELWKGQYGINTGAEMGLYYADTFVFPEDYSTTQFHAVKDEDLPCFSMELLSGRQCLFQRSGRHWWMTGFLMGRFCQPKDLTLKASVTFPDYEMLDGILQALDDQSYPRWVYSINCSTLTFLFHQPVFFKPCKRSPIICRFSQWKNRKFCGLFLFVTRPFCTAEDRLLYLYYFLPAAFRKTVLVCKPGRYKIRRRKFPASIRHPARKTRR